MFINFVAFDVNPQITLNTFYGLVVVQGCSQKFLAQTVSFSKLKAKGLYDMLKVCPTQLGGTVSPPVGPGQSPGGGSRGKAPPQNFEF